MKRIAVALSTTLLLAGCGRDEIGTEVSGQVKRVLHVTPLICGNRYEADISLGSMRNGIGSVSHEDIIIQVDDEKMAAVLSDAAKSGSLITATYDNYRVVLFCGLSARMTNVKLAQ